jgi:nucleoside-diphosphate-sugar epimerase
MMMNKQSKHVILGTGQLGLAIMDELLAQGEQVRLVNRSGSLNETLPEGVTLETADPAGTDSLPYGRI